MKGICAGAATEQFLAKAVGVGPRTVTIEERLIHGFHPSALAFSVKTALRKPVKAFRSCPVDNSVGASLLISMG